MHAIKAKIEEKKKYLLHWMYDFIEDDDEPAYRKEDVDECNEILTTFLNEAGSNPNRSNFSWLSTQVEILVKQLNDLNAKHEQQLIETDQRDDLCSLIRLVLEDAGHPYDVDITEEWREW